MVCYHQSECGVDFALLKPEIETLLDEGIALEEGDKKQALEDKKAETLKITEEKIKAFNFWESVEIPEISIKKSSESGEMKNHIPQKFELKLPDKTIFKPYKLASPFLQTHKLKELKLPEIPEIEVSYSKMPAQPKFWHFNPVAFVEHMRRTSGTFTVIFPFDIKPQNDKDNSTYNGKEWYATAETNGITFGADRTHKGVARKHAGRDLYASWGTPIRAMADGEVIEVTYWSSLKVGAVAIAHKTSDGRSFICRYCEVDYNSIAVKVGDKNIKQGDIIARVGFLKYSDHGNMPPTQSPRGIRTNMLHFELYSNGNDYANIGVNEKTSINIYARKRTDVADPLEILQEAYNNSFVKSEPEEPTRVDIKDLRTSDKGIEFIKLYEGTHKSGSKHVKYDDSLDPKKAKATIGYGHLIANTNKAGVTYSNSNEIKNGITKSEFMSGIDDARATQLLRQDLITAENGVKKHIKVPLSQNEFDALVSLSFNSGADRLGQKKGGGDTQIKILINKGDYCNGIDEIADITNGLTAGLVKRRQAEMTIFKSNYYATKIP